MLVNKNSDGQVRHTTNRKKRRESNGVMGKGDGCVVVRDPSGGDDVEPQRLTTFGSSPPHHLVPPYHSYTPYSILLTTHPLITTLGIKVIPRASCQMQPRPVRSTFVYLQPPVLHSIFFLHSILLQLHIQYSLRCFQPPLRLGVLLQTTTSRHGYHSTQHCFGH